MRFAFILPLLVATSAQASFLEEDQPAPPVAGSAVQFEPLFSGGHAISPSIVSAIAGAGKSVYVSAHFFRSKPVSQALFEASKAGRDVKIVLERKEAQSPYSASQFLLAMSRSLNILKGDGELNADFILIDGRDVIVGPFALSADEADERKNAQSVLIIRNAPELAQRYSLQWQSLWAESEAMKKEK